MTATSNISIKQNGHKHLNKEMNGLGGRPEYKCHAFLYVVLSMFVVHFIPYFNTDTPNHNTHHISRYILSTYNF